MRLRKLAPLLLLAACHTVSSREGNPQEQAQLPMPAGIDASILDRTVDPCNDFYQFACGGWMATTQIPPDRPTWSRSFSEIQERNQTLLRDVLEGYARGEHLDELPEAKKLGDFWSACMDEGAVEAAGLQPLDAELARLHVRDAPSLERAVAHLQGEGIAALFRLGVDQDARDATQMIAMVTQGGLGLPDRDYYLRDDAKLQKVRDLYLVHVAKTLELAGMPAAEAHAQADAIFTLEKSLAESALTRVERRDPVKTYHRVELEGLQQLAPHFDWAALFVDLGHPGLRAINVAEPAYFQKLDSLLVKTPPATWDAYLRWRLLDALAATLPKSFVDEDFAFTSAALTGTEQILPRWKRCVAATDRNLGFALAHAYVNHAFAGSSKAAAAELVQRIEAQFGQDLDSLTWMDGTTRATAHQKLAALTNLIGYPDVWRSYDSVEVQRGQYLRNVLSGRTFEVQYQLDKVGKPVDLKEFDMTPTTVNAYYNDSRNQMVFLAGILQPPFFLAGNAPAVNAGGIGMVVGHELTHGFDDKGRLYDAQGNLRDWWSQASGAEFTQRASCVQKQYDGYVAVDDVHVNGALTLGENIADLGGLKLAYRAMKAAEAQKPSSTGAFTPEQAFFLAHAQAWCRKDRDAYARLLATIDPHSPARWRVVGPLSNLREFADAFHCPAGAPMAHANADRCEVW